MRRFFGTIKAQTLSNQVELVLVFFAIAETIIARLCFVQNFIQLEHVQDTA